MNHAQVHVGTRIQADGDWRDTESTQYHHGEFNPAYILNNRLGISLLTLR